MNKLFKIACASALSLVTTTSYADVNAAFFLEWATPNQEAKVKKLYDEAMGVKVNWTNFATGVEMTEAMLSGDIDISYLVESQNQAVENSKDYFYSGYFIQKL